MVALRGPCQDQGPTVWSAVWMQGSSPEGGKKKKKSSKILIKIKKKKRKGKKTPTTLNQTALRLLLKSLGWSSSSDYF